MSSTKQCESKKLGTSGDERMSNRNTQDCVACIEEGSTLITHPERCVADEPAAPQNTVLAKTFDGCRACINAFGTSRTFYKGADSRCANGCCPNSYPCSGSRTAGSSCSGTAYNDVSECD